MNIAFVSDTRGNAPALQAVLKHMESQEIDSKVHLGNIIGYSPFPNETIDLTVLGFNFILRGPYDNASISRDEVVGLSSLESELVNWTKANTHGEKKLLISNLQEAFVTPERLLFTNGTPSKSVGKIMNDNDAELAFANPVAEYDIAFTGNSGVPSIWTRTTSGTTAYVRIKARNNPDGTAVFKYQLKDGERAIVNVGSAGLSKDSDNRACYVIFNTESREITFYRVNYSLDRTIGKLQQTSLPNQSWMRLLNGQ